MKSTALLFASALLGCACTQAAEPDDTANVYIKDQRFRLVAVDGQKVTPKASHQYQVQAGARTLELQRMIPSATAPGKSLGYHPTPTEKFVTLNTSLSADGNYILHSGNTPGESVPTLTRINPDKRSSELATTYKTPNSAATGFGETP